MWRCRIAIISANQARLWSTAPNTSGSNPAWTNVALRPWSPSKGVTQASSFVGQEVCTIFTMKWLGSWHRTGLKCDSKCSTKGWRDTAAHYHWLYFFSLNVRSQLSRTRRHHLRGGYHPVQMDPGRRSGLFIKRLGRPLGSAVLRHSGMWDRVYEGLQPLSPD